MGKKDRVFDPLPRDVSLGGANPQGQLPSPPRGAAGPLVRKGPGQATVHQGRQAFGGRDGFTSHEGGVDRLNARWLKKRRPRIPSVIRPKTHAKEIKCNKGSAQSVIRGPTGRLWRSTKRVIGAFEAERTTELPIGPFRSGNTRRPSRA